MIETSGYDFKYQAMEREDRKKVLPRRNICSISPAENWGDVFFTGNGKQKMNLLGNPEHEIIAFKQELLFEPMWKNPPQPPALAEIMKEIRFFLRNGEPDKAVKLVSQAQTEAGYDPFMNRMETGAIIPVSMLRSHQAFRLAIEQSSKGKIRNYLRWLDLMNGEVTVQWEDSFGSYKREALSAYSTDVNVIRFTAWNGASVNAEVEIQLPTENKFEGEGLRYPGKCRQKLENEDGIICYELAYDPEYGEKGYCSVVRFIPEGGQMEGTGRKVSVRDAKSLLVISKTVKLEKNFRFGCGKELKKEMQKNFDFEELRKENQTYLGEKMRRSGIRFRSDDQDYEMAGEELLAQIHTKGQLDPVMLEKLYDMGRFYQIADTGTIPPLWGQHNINTNLQVCSGNSTGLFEEMDTYFRYYENKFEDFRINAQRLFGARGVLASIHCDYDSGLLYHFSSTYPHYCWTGCLGWIYNEFWGYYLVTGDKKFLEERIIPALKEIALFFEDYACDRDENGRTIFYPSFSPENPTPYYIQKPEGLCATSINSVMDIMICREVLDHLIEGCKELGIEKEQIPHWEKQRKELPVYLLDEEGGLKEWAWPGIPENYNHRHVSHHYALWPGHELTWENEPELARAIMISNRKRGHQDESAHGIIHRLFSAIRLKDLEDTVYNLQYLMSHGYVTKALNTNHYPYAVRFPDLQGAMPAILAEMCVFSSPGMVEFLPAMPETLKTGRIEGIWLYTWMKLEYMEWSPEWIKADLVSVRDQKVEIMYRKGAAEFWVNGNVLAKDQKSITAAFQAGEKISVMIRR